MKKHFLTFADKRLKLSSERIKTQAKAMEAYDNIIVADESHLDIDFTNKFADKLNPAIRGFGYMCWKSQIILQTLNSIDDGDLLQWTDVDCHLNPNGRHRLAEYFSIVETNETGILGFQTKLPEDPTLLEDVIVLDQFDRKFTKGDLFDHFAVRNNQEITDTEMIITGSIFFRKCNRSVDLVKTWLNIPYINFNLIDDSPSVANNLPGFFCHKNDQSIFSIIAKLDRIDTISFYETAVPINFNSVTHRVRVSFDKLGKYPLHHKGDKQ